MPQTKRQSRSTRLAISLVSEQSVHAVDEAQLVAAVESVLSDWPYRSATVSIAVVDDAAMHELNHSFLDHDWPTDVLSFVLEDRDGHLEGEIILSADTAAAEAADVGWPAAAEQMLYVIHGALHLVGHDDKTPADAAAMRAAEVRYLRQFGYQQPQGASVEQSACQPDAAADAVTGDQHGRSAT